MLTQLCSSTGLYERTERLRGMKAVLAETREYGKGLPKYVEKEFREYLKSGQLEHGQIGRAEPWTPAAVEVGRDAAYAAKVH